MPHRITAKLYKKNQYKNLTLNNMQEKILQEIGLTNSEIIVYTALLKSGSTKVGELMKRINLHRSRVYEAIERLIENGLVYYGNLLRNKHANYFLNILSFTVKTLIY